MCWCLPCHAVMCCDVLCVVQVDKIFSGVDPQQLAAAAGAAAADESLELTPEQFAAMRRDVEQLGEQIIILSSKQLFSSCWIGLFLPTLPPGS